MYLKSWPCSTNNYYADKIDSTNKINALIKINDNFFFFFDKDIPFIPLDGYVL